MLPFYILGLIFIAGGVFCLALLKEKAEGMTDATWDHILNLECLAECRVPEEFGSVVIEELNKRKAKIVTNETVGSIKSICFEVRVGEMFNFVDIVLRSYAQGRGSLSIEPKFSEQINSWSEKDKKQLEECFSQILGRNS